MSAGRKITDARDARACLKAARSSGTPRAEWARAHGVDGRSLHAWALNLARSDASPAARPRLVELGSTPVEAPSTARYVVRVGALALEVSDDFDDAVLARLVRVLRAC